MKKHRKDSVISLLKRYLDLNFGVIKKTDNSRYANGKGIRLVKLGPTALFSNFKLTTSSSKHLEDISHAHIVSPMYKLLTSKRDSDVLSIGFDRSRDRRKQEISKYKNKKVKYHLRITLKAVFGFA